MANDSDFTRISNSNLVNPSGVNNSIMLMVIICSGVSEDMLLGLHN